MDDVTAPVAIEAIDLTLLRNVGGNAGAVLLGDGVGLGCTRCSFGQGSDDNAP